MGFFTCRQSQYVVWNTVLKSASQLGLIVPSVVLPLEHNIVLNPLHPAISNVKVLDIYDFSYDKRMFAQRV